MDIKTVITIAMLFGAMVCGGVFVTGAKEGQVLIGLASGGLIGTVSGMMLLGVLSIFVKKDEQEPIQNHGRGGFDDPKPMTNQHLLSAIAGQADWLEKMSRSPIESQNSPSIVELARKRRNYVAHLCMEVVSRGATDDDPNNQKLKYPGATIALNVFSEVCEYAKELEAAGNSKEHSAVKSVKERLFVANGVLYPARWEV